jgi:hypothetical protein
MKKSQNLEELPRNFKKLSIGKQASALLDVLEHAKDRESALVDIAIFSNWDSEHHEAIRQAAKKRATIAADLRALFERSNAVFGW